MPNFKDLKLTAAQQKKFDALSKAYDECIKEGIKFISFDECMYPLNGKKLNSIDPERLAPRENPLKQFSACSMPSGWDFIHIEEPYCQITVTFTLK